MDIPTKFLLPPKQAMDFDCQLHILKERGLTVENEEDALKFLHSVSYFRFANYLQPMEQFYFCYKTICF